MLILNHYQLFGLSKYNLRLIHSNQVKIHLYVLHFHYPKPHIFDPYVYYHHFQLYSIRIVLHIPHLNQTIVLLDLY